MHLPHTRRGKAGLAAILGAALVAAPLVATPAFAAPDPTETINLLNINDFHGRIDANTVKFAGTVEKLRAESKTANGDVDNSLFLSAGDNISASLFASASQGDKPTIDVLNALGLQASAVGNHEFDKGFTDLTGRVDDAANWDYLGANVYKKGTKDPALDEYTTLTTGNGVKVAVIGAVTAETPTLVSPGGITTIDVGDPVEAVNRVVGEIGDLPAADQPDVIVAEYHEGASEGTPDGATFAQETADPSSAFSKIVNNTSPKVAAIFTGHTHKQYAWEAPIPGASGTRPVIQTGDYGEGIGQVKLTVDTATNTVTDHTTPAVVARLAPVLPKTATADEIAAASAAMDTDLINTYPRVSQVNDITKAALAQAAVIGNQPVGKLTADITTAYIGTNRDDRASESTLGDTVADALVDTLAPADLGGAEIGVVNPGGLRDELKYKASGSEGDGVITYAEANAVLPFVNNLWTTSLTGAQFKTALEQQWQTNANGSTTGISRPYLQLGLSKNVSYTYDPNAAQGSHITSISINGAPIDLTKSYRIGTFSFLTTGGDNFREFANGANAKDSGLVDRDGWIAYIQKNSTGASALTPSFARRGVAVGNLPTGITAQGKSGTISLAKLDLTSLGSPKNTTVSAAFAGSKAKPIVSPVTDGAATAAYKVPFDTPANATLVLTASPSGTEVRIPITTSIAIDSNQPKIVGANKVGSTLKARTGTWDPRPVKLTYRWLRDGKAIKGATTKAYKLKASDKGHKIVFSAKGTKSGYPTVVRHSEPVKVYLALKKTPRPTISGTGSVGHRLTVVAHKWSPAVHHTYKWYRNGVAITGATAKGYTLVAADKGKKITVKVFGIRTGYLTETETRSIATIK